MQLKVRPRALCQKGFVTTRSCRFLPCPALVAVLPKKKQMRYMQILQNDGVKKRV